MDTKTILILAVVGVGGFMLYKSMQPTTGTDRGSNNNSNQTPATYTTERGGIGGSGVTGADIAAIIGAAESIYDKFANS